MTTICALGVTSLLLGVATLLVAARVSAAEPATGTHGMVVASQPDATAAGLAVLAAGGNAVDAAVATAFAISVTQPFSAGVGGGAFMVLRAEDGEVVAIDARETAPAAAQPDMYVRQGVPRDASVKGALAVATPGFVRGMALALERFGTLPLADLLAPAIRLADEGFEIGAYHAGMLERMRALGLPKFFPETGRTQFPRAGVAAAPGWRLRQKDLATTLRTLAEQGPDTFYTGEIAERIVAEVTARGGLLSAADLAGYRPKLRPEVRGTYRGLEVISFPPPSSGGGVLIEILNILEGFDLASLGPRSPAAAHRMVEAMKLAFADRAFWYGDPDFVEVPLARLTAKSYAKELREKINPPWYKISPGKWGQDDRALEVEGPGLPVDDSGTLHFSVTDAAGNAVALTMTINTPFGSGITVPGTGIVLNNEMDDFSKATGKPNVYGLVDERGANAVAAGKRPLSSMTPSILLKDGRLFMVTGSPGGPRIITTTLHSIVNVVDFGMNVQEAVAAPRYHHQWIPRKVSAEPELDAAVVEGLRERGHEVDVSKRTWSNAQVIVIDPETGLHTGGSDPRGDGVALGFNPEAQGSEAAAAAP
ncbi:MAG: gamma-glutamyltransferase [Myxococcota bacterium]|nr:gamma-glutamyltransferase [Myxococcota bacterium]